jgi:drug/metabolite transporter (DMT)-like permease
MEHGKHNGTRSMNTRLWLGFAGATTVCWGAWGAFIEIPERAGFPATLGYVVWALTMIPCALVALRLTGWQLDHDRNAIILGAVVGLLGAGGQLLLFQALRTGPAYIVFPIISLYPMLTVFLSVVRLKEQASLRVWTGIILAAPAILLLSWQPADGHGHSRSIVWLTFPLLVFLAWGVQAYFMKFSNKSMRAESIFFYMTATGVALIPVALALTDFRKPVNFGFTGPYLAALVHSLNSIGALCLVYAFRFGKAIVVSPMTALAPLLTIILSMAIHRVVPNAVLITGMSVAALSIYLMAE